MPKRVVDLGGRGTPILDVASYGRRGPGHRPFTRAEIGHISRTVRRVPEVMVKVSGGARTLAGVESHLDYIGREGDGVIETDDGRTIQEKGFERDLVADWNLGLHARRRHTERAIAVGRKPPKLVHNLVLSMPIGTPAEKVLAAVRTFTRAKFALQHRYAMTLHTDQGHPHVHVVVKAVSEEGVRLNIRKATLREWRRDFARCLRDLGIEANATERAVRGQIRSSKRDGIYRAAGRGESTYILRRRDAVAQELTAGRVREDPGRMALIETRRLVVGGWLAVAALFERQRQSDLGALVRRFAQTMPAPQTEREILRDDLARHQRARSLDDQVRAR